MLRSLRQKETVHRGSHFFPSIFRKCIGREAAGRTSLTRNFYRVPFPGAPWTERLANREALYLWDYCNDGSPRELKAAIMKTSLQQRYYRK
jgi:hypothetical protein